MLHFQSNNGISTMLMFKWVQKSIRLKDFINGINSPSIFHFNFPHHYLSKPLHIKDLVDPWKSGNKETNHWGSRHPRSLVVSQGHWSYPPDGYSLQVSFHQMQTAKPGQWWSWSAGTICYWYSWFYQCHTIIILTHIPLVPHLCISELGQHWFR